MGADQPHRALRLLVIILILFWPLVSVAGLIAEKTSIAIGESLYIQLQAEGARNVRWAAGPELRILSSDDKGAQVQGVLAGNARLQALWMGGKESIAITVDDNQLWGKSGPELQRLSYDQRQMANLLRRANQQLDLGMPPNEVARQFYTDLAKLGLKDPLVQLNKLKTELQKIGLADSTLGARFEHAAGTPVERALLVYRRDLTLEAIRAAVAEVGRRFGPETGTVFLAKIGKWAVQHPDQFVFAGDIDFSFVGARPEVILALRDVYAEQIRQRSGGLDMVGIDSLATAHGFAEHHVYIGVQGRKFADDAMRAMDEGVERIDFRDPEATGTSRAQAVPGEQALFEIVLEETALRYRQSGYEDASHNQLEAIDRALNERTRQTVEPFLSMEMARHLDRDIIQKADVFAAIDIVKKGAKYLRRSNDQTGSDLGVPATDAALAKFVRDVDEMAKDKKVSADQLVKFIDAELKRLGISGFEMRIVDGKAVLEATPDGVEKFLARVKDTIWKNVSAGMDARIRALTDAINNRGQASGSGTPDDMRPERLADTLRMLAEGLKVMKAEQVDIPPDILTKASVLTRLVESYGSQRSYPLPAEEIEKIKKLLQECVSNDTTLLLKMGIVTNHIDQWLVKNYDRLSAKLPASRRLAQIDARIDSLNSVLDVLDNRVLDALRNKGVLELELGQGADGKPRIYATTFPRIAAINQRLNESILGRIGNNTAFKAFNLAQEGEAYYSAIMQANTPSEAFSNVATEIFRRRVPGGGAVEAWVMEDYTRMGIEIVYTLFPPLAIPEGLYGMGTALYESGRQAWWHSNLETLIDDLYAQAEFGKDTAHTGYYPLTHVTYKGVRYSRQGLEQGKSFILDPDVDRTLSENLRASDPFLSLMAELENHQAAGEKVRAHFRTQAERRWIELKREFIAHMIERLEKRHAAEVADLTGQLPAIYAELVDIAEQLEIRERIDEQMDSEWDSSNLKAFWTWLKNLGRQGAWGGTLAETERNKAAAILMRYRDAYRSVLVSREHTEAEIARILAENGLAGQNVVQHNQRLLTGIVFLSGQDAQDKQIATHWKGMPARIEKQVRGELSAIKSGYVKKTALDSDFDRRALGQVFFEDIWIEALRSMKVPVISAASYKRAADTRKERRAQLIKAYEDHYAKLTAGDKDDKGQDKVGKDQDKPGQDKDTPGSTGGPTGTLAKNADAKNADAEAKDTDLPTPPAPKFSATLPGNWEMQPIKDGVRFVRKVAKTKGPCGWDSSVSGSVTALFKAGTMDDKALQARIAETQAGLEKQKAQRKIGCATPDMAVGLFKAGGLDGVASLALGEFKGGIVDYPNWVRRGSGGWMSGYTGSSMIACGNGAAHGKSGSIEFSYSASGGGCWDNSDRAYLVRQVLAAQKEARAIIASLRLDGGGIRTEPYKGPKYDGSDNPLVRLLPEKLPKLKVGDLATVEAVVENAEPEDPPFTYDWDGNFHGKAEDLKKSAKVTLHPQKPGKYKVGVSVSGQRYGMGYASLEYEVADVQVKVERVPNENTPVPVGGRARFKATVLIDGKPAEGAYIYRWQPNTELVFSATESATASQTTATFTRLDERQKLWVEVLERKEGRLATVGESDRLEIRVIQPRLSLGAEPKEPLVGQETLVTLKDEPRLDDKVAGFRWAHKGDALNPGPTQDERVFTFKPKNLKPVTVTARGYLRDGNVDLGEAELAIQPKAYEVKLNPPRARGPQLQVWVCDTQLGQAQKCGMKDIPQGQFATFQDILIQSAVTPQPTAPRYRWSVEPSGSCGLPGAGSELRLKCSNTGSYTVKLQVTDADNVLLGEAETSVTVSVSDKDVKQAPKSKEAYEKMQQARQKANEGLLDEAIALAGTASGLDPKNSEARDLGNRWSNERNTVSQLLERAKKALAAMRPDEAQKELDAAKKLHPKYPPVIEVEKQIADQRKGVPSTTGPGVTTTAQSQPISLAGVGGKQGTPRLVKGVVIDDGSWIRFKSTDENRRSLDIPVPTPTRAEAVAIVSNLDDATYLEQGTTIARILVGKDSGDEVLEIQAGVHSSEWNYGVGPKHKRVDSADIGGNRFLVVLPLARPGMVRGLRIEYVETHAPKWAGHAPGFVLRGISLVADTRGLTLTPGGHSASTVAAGTVNVAGQWRTSEGVMTLTQNGRAVTGNYTNDGGEIVGEMNDNVLEGWWIENSSNERCAAPKNGRYYWGRIRFTFSGERFAGTWSYCDKPATVNPWTGERIDTASAGGASLHLDRTAFKPGERIEVRFTAPASWPDDAWVGIVPSGIPHGDERQNDNHDIAYQYLNKRTAGTLTFTAPAAGDWDFRLHDTDRNGKEYASVSFRVATVDEDGRDYTGGTPVPGGAALGYLRIEACVDGSDWIRIDNGRLTHEHRAFNQIGTHPSCPASHQVAGGGFLVDGQPVALDQLPRTVGMAGIDRIEVERGRGVVRLDGPNRILIDDDGPGGADVYIIRVYPGAGSSVVGDGVPGGRDYTGYDSSQTGPSAPPTGGLIFEVGNIYGVGNGPSSPTTFTLAQAHHITLIRDYHWNSARGAKPGTIALRDANGRVWGPWQATGSPGQGGVPNAYWTVYPNVTLPAGTYTVIDSDPASWSHNAESENRGFVYVEGYAIDASQSSR